ncbi:MAG: MFS transporter [Defluviitaleaceae bacterium]|nr:MFS transporter [Defluviitaleaceae bacterium]
MKKILNIDFINSFLLILASISTNMGNTLFLLGINLWILQTYDSIRLLGIVSAVSTIPIILFSLTGGVLSDFANKKYIIVICDALSGIICLIFLLFFERIDITYVIILTILLSIIHSIFSSAIRSLPPYVIEQNNIKKFNSALNFSFQFVNIVTPMLFGFIILVFDFSLRLLLLLKGLSLIISAFFEMFLKIKYYHEKERVDKLRVVNSIVSSIKYLRKQKYIFSVILLASFVNIFIAGYNIFLPYYAEYFEASHFYGFFLSIESAGGIIGSILTMFIFKKDIKISIYLAISGLFLILTFFDYDIAFMSIAVLGFGIFLSVFNITFFSYLQNNISVEFLGRVISLTSSLALVFMPIGDLIFGFLIEVIGINSFGFIGLCILLLSTLHLLFLKFYKI